MCGFKDFLVHLRIFNAVRSLVIKGRSFLTIAFLADAKDLSKSKKQLVLLRKLRKTIANTHRLSVEPEDLKLLLIK